jgi:hypothetical protein
MNSIFWVSSADGRNTKGRMGDIRGKPTEEDLLRIKEDAEK